MNNVICDLVRLENNVVSARVLIDATRAVVPRGILLPLYTVHLDPVLQHRIDMMHGGFMGWDTKTGYPLIQRPGHFRPIVYTPQAIYNILLFEQMSVSVRAFFINARLIAYVRTDPTFRSITPHPCMLRLVPNITTLTQKTLEAHVMMS